MREARAAYRAIPGRPAHERRRRPVDSPLFVSVAARAQRAAAGRRSRCSRTRRPPSDPDAAALAARMQRAAAAMLPSFDTGYWTYYSLPHEASPLDYQQYVVQLLKKLAPSDPRFADAATRFAAYQRQPPAFQLDERVARSVALLAVEARDRAGEHRRRPDEATRPERRLAHARVARAEAPGRLPRARHGRRLGREQGVVRRAADRARDRGRGGDVRARKTSRRRRSAGVTFAVGAALDDPAQGAHAAEARSSTRADRRHVARRRHHAGPERRRSPAAPARRSRQRRSN